ncbi:leucyl aminopeptidase [Nitzschia inconspicua]|uniref:Leucyl aminopeptidase n=1 Tax=Nitzschia inconspicua TaxID=303405 RepID=A0A9K3LPH0_9STRA|nr:leucyl aminopeptidase [Nitzschia inconspicua]KAG7365962.1 leucyl aminopeptidase [Nitzschia inconspicua]
MVHICLTPHELIDPSTQIIDTLCVIGTVKAFQSNLSWVLENVLPVALTAPNTSMEGGEPHRKKPKVESQQELDTSASLIQRVLSTLQPSLDTAASTELWLPRDPLLLRVVLIALPATVSRHNSSSQPYAVSSNLKKFVRPKESTAVVGLFESSEVYATICAVSRVGGGLLYNRKTGGKTDILPNSDSHHSHAMAPLLLGGISMSETALPDLNHMRVVFPPSASPEDKEVGLWRTKMCNVALGIQLARRLVDAPCNELDTTAFLEQAMAVVQGVRHVTTKVIKGKELMDKGYGGLYNVGKAALQPPALVILSYVPPDVKDEPSIVLVGKGIVFDTGGLQIKPKPTMPGMKRDMGGAAAILSAFGAFVRSAPYQPAVKRPVHAVLCLAENAVANDALRADDIITMYSGKTVEINNTDAEGRLVLGDGVCHASRHLNPSTIIDMATLTGAQGVATGKYFGALYCNDEALEQSVVTCGKYSGDLCHPMPYVPEFFKQEYTSAVADMKNSVADRANAQVSCAGQFIGNHISDWLAVEGKRWCHVDMAYPVFDKKDERATGYGVGLLYSLLEQYSQE